MSLKQDKTQLSARQRRPLWLKILLIGLAVVIVLIALGPTIVSISPLRNWALGKINRQINGRVSIDSWSIGWFTGVEIQGLSLEDENSKPVVVIKNLSLDPSYFSLLGQNPRLGKIKISSLRLDIRLDSLGRTNLEKISPPSELERPSEIQPSFELQIVDSTIVVHKPDVAPLSIHNINASVHMPPSAKLVSFKLNCNVSGARAQGEIQAEGSIPRLEGGDFALELIKASAKVSVKELDLQLLSPLLCRAGLKLEISGLLDLQGHVQLDGLENIELDFQVKSAEISFRGDLLKSDTLHLRDFSLHSRAHRRDMLLSLDELRLDSDLIVLQTSGTMHLGSTATLAELGSAGLKGELTADLPKILNQLPSTLQLQPGLKITSGELTANYSITTTDGNTELIGSVALGNLQGSTANRTIQLDEPIELSFDLVRNKEQELGIRSLSATSGFGRLSASGQAKDIAIQAEIDLAKLNTQLAKFIDLGEIDFAGQLLCDAKLITEPERLDFELDLAGTDLFLHGLTPRDLREPQAKLNLRGSLGRDENNQINAVTIKQAQLLTDQTQLQFSGSGKVQPLSVSGQMTLKTDLAKVDTYLSQFIDLGQVRFAGQLLCQADIATLDRQVNFQVDLTAKELVVSGLESPDIREPKLQVTLDGSLTRSEDNKIAGFSFKQAQFVTDQTQLQFAGNCNIEPLSVSGQMKLKTDLAKVDAYLSQFIDLGKLKLAGHLLCEADITTLDRQVNFQADLTVNELVVSGLASTELREPHLQVTLDGSLTRSEDNKIAALSFKQAQFVTDRTQLQFTGQVDLEPLAVSGQVKLKSDLSTLQNYLVQFIDLGKLKLAGQLLCQADITTLGRQVNFQADLTADELVVGGVASSELCEPHLQVTLEGSLTRSENNKIAALSFKQAQLLSNRVQVQFSGQIDPEALAIIGQARIKADLARVQELAEAFDSFPEDIKQLQGQLDSAVTLTAPRPKAIGCEGQSNIQNLRIVRKAGQTVHEPSVNLRHKLIYDIDTQSLDGELPELKLAGLSVRVPKLTLTPGPTGEYDINTRVSFQGDLGLLNPWLVAFAKLDPKVELAGQLTGKGSYSREAQQERFALDTDILNLKLRPPDRAVFVEPKISLQVEGSADRAAGTLELSRLDVTSGFLQVNAQVTTGLSAGASPAKIILRAQSDLQRLSRVMEPWFSDWPELTGSGSANMTLTGTPGSRDWIASLSGPATVHIDPQELWGVSLGATDINMHVKQGVLIIPPSTILANKGKINFQARVSLTEVKPFLVISQPINLVEDVQVNAQMSDALLKFINPVFADNNQVSGSVSFICNNLLIDDLATWKKTAKMNGLFSGKDLLFRPRKGLMASLGSVLGVDMSSKLGEMRPVSIELANGIISYKDMHLVFSSLLDLSFSGEIGLDESLNMRVGIPILPSMLTNNPELSEIFVGQRIYMPITGTLSEPRLDVGAFPGLLLEQITDILGEQIPKKIGDLLKDIFK